LEKRLLKFLFACILLISFFRSNKSYGAVTYTVTSLTTYLSPSPLEYGQTGVVIFGFQIKAVVTGASTTIATMVIHQMAVMPSRFLAMVQVGPFYIQQQIAHQIPLT
jgi:hypothetical protein